MSRAAVLWVGLWLAAGASAAAQPVTSGDLADLAFRPHPGAPLPLAARFRDEQARAVTLGQFFTGQPVILVLEYLRCKSLCGITLRGLFEALRELPLKAGRDYRVVAIGIDPRDMPADATAAKAKYLAGDAQFEAADGVHFLTGAAPQTAWVADAVGFPYRYDAALDQYLHPAGFALADPVGRVSRYFLGIDIAPDELKGGIVAAAEGETVGPLTRLLLLCHFDGSRIGRFTAPVIVGLTLANIAGMLTVAAVFAAIRRRRRR